MPEIYIDLLFLVGRGKILILLELPRVDMRGSGQNIGSKGLSDKILRNKGLAVGSGAFASEWFESGRMIR
jgi:hypothetical protein